MIRWRNRCKDGWIDAQMDEWTNKSMLLGTTEKKIKLILEPWEITFEGKRNRS